MRRATRELGDLGVLIRLFLLADDCPAGDVAAALAPLTIAQCVDAGLLEGENFDSENPLVRAAVDLRPIDVGDGDRWVISDLDGGIRPKKPRPIMCWASGMRHCPCCRPRPPRGSAACSTSVRDAASKPCTRTRTPIRSPQPTSINALSTSRQQPWPSTDWTSNSFKGPGSNPSRVEPSTRWSPIRRLSSARHASITPTAIPASISTVRAN